MNFFNQKIFIFVFFFLSFFLFIGKVDATSVGDIVNFNVDKSFDNESRTKLTATLVKATNNIYFYIEKYWWDQQSQVKQFEVLNSLDNLSKEFDNNIYPNIVSLFGSERKPGVDNDTHITILFEAMNSNEGGYFREADGYTKIQMPISNEREMVYLSLDKINDPQLKVILAHEFVHLITFHQKNINLGIEEDTWLNEARADYTSTILGYDSNYANSNLKSRVKDFIENPSDSITEWGGTKYDYASVSLFTHYLVDHYGINILSDSMKSKYVSVESINFALQKNGIRENFGQIFSNWTISLLINDCSQNSKYCYLNENLKKIAINPTLIFLPLSGNSSLSSTNVTKNWSGNWQKIIGGNGDLELNFSSLLGLSFQVPYVIYGKDGGYSINFLQLDVGGKGKVNIQDFGTKYKSLIVVPSLQTKKSGFDITDFIYPYTLKVSINGEDLVTDQLLIQKLLAQIEDLKRQIAEILAKREGLIIPNDTSCSLINNNLSLGIMNNNEVRCLQNFLKKQGLEIYPEGLITGNFGNLTRQAVVRYQTKYGIPATGFVGPLTRGKINSSL